MRLTIDEVNAILYRNKNMENAIHEYQELKERKIHPDGKFDSKGRFYLSEKFDCCHGIRVPSTSFPYSEMKHGRTLKHVCAKYKVDELEARMILKALQ